MRPKEVVERMTINQQNPKYNRRRDKPYNPTALEMTDADWDALARRLGFPADWRDKAEAA